MGEHEGARLPTQCSFPTEEKTKSGGQKCPGLFLWHHSKDFTHPHRILALCLLTGLMEGKDLTQKVANYVSLKQMLQMPTGPGKERT